MDYKFSDRVQNLNPSAIREILKFTADPEVVSLSAGNPAPEAFPIKDITEISARVFAQRPFEALQYGATEGYGKLRRRIAAYMGEKHNLVREFDNVLITSGAQQVVELAAKVLCNPNDVVICEAPSFIGSLNSFRSLGGKLVGVPMQDDGMDLNALELALKSNANTKIIYTIPNFQNPSGITMSFEKRRLLYDLARQYDVVIVEDNPYGDLRYEGEDVKAIKSLDEDGRVVYAGSFSKVLSPGIRVGYAIAHKTLLQKMTVCKQGEDVHTTMWSQILCDEYMGGYDFEAHLDELRDIYRKKAELMLSLIKEHLVPHGITYSPMQGGLFIWCRLPDGVDMPSFCKRAVMDYKVAVVPGNAFLVDENQPCQNFRLNFSTPTDDAMRKGVAKLGELAKEVMK
ncbi:MAG: PLP-dependent aminotransferase family protein [Oscillospiraceae bacterium]|nr:PLP-dependent aminotransferase family protein [Oscillospiraceae bacterium]MDD4546709.1 PLP-dependent aminotransferase family protein [Oscillospiraceae bacterium]